jgi:hypothetical protein
MRFAFSMGCFIAVTAMAQTVTISSTFYSNGTFNPSIGWGIVYPAQMAYPFTVSGTVSYAFASASLGLSEGIGTANSLTISLAADAGGIPGSLLETFTVNGALQAFPNDTAPVTVTSVLQPLLKAGSVYWLIIGTNSPGNGVNWLTAYVLTTPDLLASRSSTGVWTASPLLYTYDNPGAFSVSGASLAPTLSYPALGAFGVSRAPTLSWNPAIGATSYDVYVGVSASLTLVGSTTGTSYPLPTLLPNQPYYWQIVANSAVGSSPSALWFFTTQLSAPTPVIPVLNFNGGADQGVYLYDPVAGIGYAALSNGSGGFTYVYSPFTPGFDAIRYGTFTNSGLSDLVAYHSTTATGYVLLGSGSGTFSSAVSLFLGPGFTKVAMGDLNGDGLTDFLIYRSTDGTSYTAISNGDGTFRYQYTLVSGGYTHVLVADFNGDGKADVLFYRSTDGLAYLGISNGTGGFTFSQVSLSPGYTFVESGDINGDGMADLLFYNGTSGAAAVGLSTGSGFTFTPYQYSPGFTSLKVFDFNGDGKADVALYNMNTAIGYLGISNGTNAFTFSSLFWGPGFSTADTLDLNGDGKIDVVIYNTTNAAAYTGISTGNPASPFTYQYSFWGTGKVLATAAAQP